MMIVVVIGGSLLAVARPWLLRAHKRAVGTRIVSECLIIDNAIDMWVIENDKKKGEALVTNAIAVYLQGTWPTHDMLSNPYIYTVVGTTQVQLNAATKSALNGVGIDWTHY